MTTSTLAESISQRLNKKRINFSPYQWEGLYNGLYDEIKSYEDIKAHLSKPVPKIQLGEDTNKRIFIMGNIIPEIVNLLTLQEKRDLENILKNHLNDNRMCDIGGSTSYADNEDTSTVSGSAEYALSCLKS